MFLIFITSFIKLWLTDTRKVRVKSRLCNPRSCHKFELVPHLTNYEKGANCVNIQKFTTESSEKWFASFEQLHGYKKVLEHTGQ